VDVARLPAIASSDLAHSIAIGLLKCKPSSSADDDWTPELIAIHTAKQHREGPVPAYDLLRSGSHTNSRMVQPRGKEDERQLRLLMRGRNDTADE
jgi:hypothetical protein